MWRTLGAGDFSIVRGRPAGFTKQKKGNGVSHVIRMVWLRAQAVADPFVQAVEILPANLHTHTHTHIQAQTDTDTDTGEGLSLTWQS